MIVYHLTFVWQISCLLGNNEIRSERLSDQIIKREPKGLSCMCCESDHDVSSIKYM